MPNVFWPILLKILMILLSFDDKYFLQIKYEDIMPRNATNNLFAKKVNFEIIE